MESARQRSAASCLPSRGTLPCGGAHEAAAFYVSELDAHCSSTKGDELGGNHPEWGWGSRAWGDYEIGGSGGYRDMAIGVNSASALVASILGLQEEWNHDAMFDWAA